MKIFLINFILIFWIISILMLVFAILTLFFERKYIAILQKRLGITMLGRNGWIHLPADLVKFWIKKSNRFDNSFKKISFMFVMFAYFLWNLIFCIFFTNNGFKSLILNYHYSFFLYFVIAGLTSIYLFNIIINLKSKYAFFAAIRINICSIFLEFLFLLVYLYLYLLMSGFSLNNIKHYFSYISVLTSNVMLSTVIIMYTLFESKRAPYDHTESESELVAGHIIEFGGRFLLLFYFSEYIHFFFIAYWLLLIIFNVYSVLTYDMCFQINNTWNFIFM